MKSGWKRARLEARKDIESHSEGHETFQNSLPSYFSNNTATRTCSAPSEMAVKSCKNAVIILDESDNESSVRDTATADLNSKPNGKSASKRPSIHIFFGGSVGEQNSPMLGALSNFGNLNVEFMYVKDVKDMDWNPEQFIDWLLQADIHWIPCHPHQGVIFQLRWNVDDLSANLSLAC